MGSEHPFPHKNLKFQSSIYRKDLCSPRVLTCIDESKWGIQLLPAYGSDFFICEFEWEKESCSVNAKAFKCLDFENFKAEMQPCGVQMEFMSNEFLLTSDRVHRFSFGPFKVAKCKLPEKEKQEAHCQASVIIDGILCLFASTAGICRLQEPGQVFATTITAAAAANTATSSSACRTQLN